MGFDSEESLQSVLQTRTVFSGRHCFGSELEVSPRQALRSSCMSWGCFIHKHMGLEEAVLSLLGELQHKALEQ